MNEKQLFPGNQNIHVAFLQSVETMHWLKNLEEYNFNIFEANLHKYSAYTIPKEMMDKGKLELF